MSTNVFNVHWLECCNCRIGLLGGRCWCVWVQTRFDDALMGHWSQQAGQSAGHHFLQKTQPFVFICIYLQKKIHDGMLFSRQTTNICFVLLRKLPHKKTADLPALPLRFAGCFVMLSELLKSHCKKQTNLTFLLHCSYHFLPPLRNRAFLLWCSFCLLIFSN